MSLSGNLEDVSVADALQFIHLGGRTGTLTLTQDEVTAEIGFHNGRIVNAWGPGSKRLGELLIETGVIDAPLLAAALKQQEEEQPRRSLGQVLVAMNAIMPEAMYRAVEQQIERTVYDLVTWSKGTFNFALDQVKPIDDIAVVPGDVVRPLNLDTQMVLLDALRIFDERNRDLVNKPPVFTPSGGTAKVKLPAKATPSQPVTPALEQRVRLQVVSADKQLAEKLAHALPEAIVVRVNLRDAGTPPPGEPPPLVLLDLRQGGVALEAITVVRRQRARASIVAVVDSGVPVSRVYQAGALVAAPGEVPALAACFRSLVENRRDLIAGGPRASHAQHADLARLRRIVGDLRSGLISTTISLSLMNIISESVERAVLFLVRRDGLVALGAFGSGSNGLPLAQASRGLKLALAGGNALTDSLADGQVRASEFEAARLPQQFAEIVGKPRSGQCAIFPVLGGQRVIALIYADNGPSNRAIEELDILELATAQAGLAFENELLRRQGTPKS
ncbi:MAG TPA: DUF4388 domain-containing protein [Myxococcales bacterium]|nr:DUF4388 domain-containing protein [Myxococcales bacterium]